MSEYTPYANRYGFSDVEPYEIIRRVSEKCVEIRSMKAELSPDWSPEFVAGGFAGHCVNNGSQRWVYSVDVNGEVLRIRLHKDGTYRSKFGERFKLSDKPVKFRDYNF
jgi:hypothetical protein